ncbi:MAG TPA: NRDE family protein [Burkholderiaceae bacterium]|nr:NRDE family protein [Burkholderiaceae bacterium]
MCLIALAIEASVRWPLVIAANRDEFHDRPAAPLAWWRHEGMRVLAGRDQAAGGTWLGISAAGRIGALTNVRDPSRARADAPSRGALVPAWLASRDDEHALWPRLAARGCNPFNLVGGDLASGRWWWADDRMAPQAIGAGVHGLSNAAFETPWPKVQRLKSRLRAALTAAHRAELQAAVLSALADPQGAPDADLPATGIGLARERVLAPAFIHVPSMRYGTRCSTLLVGERDGARWRITVTERSFDAQGAVAAEREESVEIT